MEETASGMTGALDGLDVRLDEPRYQLGQPVVSFMGHCVSTKGIDPALERIDLILRFRRTES